MKPRYLKHNEIDKFKWDRCIQAYETDLIYALSGYLDVVNPGWEALVAGDYELVMPLTVKKRWGISYLSQPPFTQQSGIFGHSEISAAVTALFIQSIPVSNRIVEINLNEGNLVPAHNNFLKNKNLLLPLHHTYEKIVSGYSVQNKRNLKKAAEAAYHVEATEDLKTIEKLFLSTHGHKPGILHEKQFTVLEKLFNLKQLTSPIALLATVNGVAASGAVFFLYKKRLTFIFSGTAAHYRNTGALNLIIDHVIQNHAKQSLLLDFEGSNQENLYRFYKGFGAYEVNYHAYHKNPIPGFVKKLRNRLR